MFSITEEEAKDIIKTYGGTLSALKKIQDVLNSIDVIDDEEDFKELVCIILSQYESIQLDIKLSKKANSDYKKKMMSLNEIIVSNLLDKYDSFQDTPNKADKFEKYLVLNKKRHD